jgi:DNA polymerase elongation subunit (family B)
MICTEHDATSHLDMLYALNKTNCPDNCDVIYSFEYEEDLLLWFLLFILYNDIDVIAGHNSGGFDLPFFRDRLAFLGYKLPSISRDAFKQMYIKTDVNKGLEKHNVYIDGRWHCDTMRFEQEAPGARDMSLNALAAKYLKKESKYDMDMTVMSWLQQHEYGRRRIGRYCIKDSVLVLDLINTVYIIGSMINSAQMFNVYPQTLMNRSQGAKLEGYLTTERMKDPNLPIIKIDKQSRNARMRKWDKTSTVSSEYQESGTKNYEGAIVVPPIPGYYKTMVLLLDFEGLYPSIIRLHNMCFRTLLNNKHIRDLGLVEGVDYVRMFSSDIVDGKLVVKQDDNMPAFVTPARRVGLLPRIEAELKARRSLVKKKCAEAVAACTARRAELGDDETLKNDPIYRENMIKICNFDAQQLAIKGTMNSFYGLTGAVMSSYHCTEIAASITGMGRHQINQCRTIIPQEFCRAKGYDTDTTIIGGDTDSVFVLTEYSDMAKAQKLGHEISKYMNEQVFTNPTNLELEGVYTHMLLTPKKKNYGGRILKTGFKTEETVTKGMYFKKRSNCRFIRTTCTRALDLIVNGCSYDTLRDHIHSTMGMLYNHEVPYGDLAESDRITMPINDYGLTRTVVDKHGKEKEVKANINCAVSVIRDDYKDLCKKLYSIGVDPPDPPGPGSIAHFVVIRSQSKKKSERVMSIQKAYKIRPEIDWDYYRDAYQKKIEKYFVIAAVEMYKEKFGIDDVNETVVLKNIMYGNRTDIEVIPKILRKGPKKIQQNTLLGYIERDTDLRCELDIEDIVSCKQKLDSLFKTCLTCAGDPDVINQCQSLMCKTYGERDVILDKMKTTKGMIIRNNGTEERFINPESLKDPIYLEKFPEFEFYQTNEGDDLNVFMLSQSDGNLSINGYVMVCRRGGKSILMKDRVALKRLL